MNNIAACLFLSGLLVGAAPAEKPIRWPELAKLDYRTGKMPPALSKKLESPVKIKGFVIPLEGDGKGVTSFVLVSDPMFCGHVPPPPPNQLVLVELEKPKPWKFFGAGGIYVTGELVVVDQQSQFGGHMYQMKKILLMESVPTGWDALFQ